jgi:hypothetical protein
MYAEMSPSNELPVELFTVALKRDTSPFLEASYYQPTSESSLGCPEDYHATAFSRANAPRFTDCVEETRKEEKPKSQII